MEDVKEEMPALLVPFYPRVAAGEAEEEEKRRDLCVILDGQAGGDEGEHRASRAGETLQVERPRRRRMALVVRHDGIMNRIAPCCACHHEGQGAMA